MPEDTEWVEIRHPDVHISDDIEPATVSREAFDAVWKDKGWDVVADEPAEVGAATPTAVSPPPAPTVPRPRAGAATTSEV